MTQKCSFRMKRPDGGGEIDGCQFEHDGYPAFLRDTKYQPTNAPHWCQFHLPIGINAVANPSNNQKIPSYFDTAQAMEKSNWGAGNRQGLVEDIAHYIKTRLELNSLTIDLSGIVIPGDFNFSGILKHFNIEEFNHAFICQSAYFGGYVSFVDFIFNDQVYFDYTVFNERADFSRAIFRKTADFNSSIFHENAIFVRAEFFSLALFSNSIRPVSNIPEHHRKLFFKDGEHKSPELTSAIFTKAQFHSSSNFINRRFLNSATFYETVFNQAPNFHGCDLPQGTTFRDAEFDGVETSDAPENYRTLKIKSRELGNALDEAHFFALEQRSRRIQTKKWSWDWVISTLYDFVSEYGQNPVKPLRHLVEVFFIFIVVYVFMAVIFIPTEAHPEFADIFSFSMVQTVQPFSIWSAKTASLFSWIDCHPILWKLIGNLQSIFSWSCITLSLLALRRRFKLQ
jgi:uncharacterized protein YjbI with pentapeptide repeats